MTAISARCWRFLMASRPSMTALQTLRDFTTQSSSSGRTLSGSGFAIWEGLQSIGMMTLNSASQRRNSWMEMSLLPHVYHSQTLFSQLALLLFISFSFFDHSFSFILFSFQGSETGIHCILLLFIICKPYY